MMSHLGKETLHALQTSKATRKLLSSNIVGYIHKRPSSATITCTQRLSFATKSSVASPNLRLSTTLSPRKVDRPNNASPELLCGYRNTLQALHTDLEQTVAGDTIIFSVYVLEPGNSTMLVLDALRRAAERGVNLDLSVDRSAASRFTSWCEGTKSRASDMLALAQAFPATVSFKGQTVPTHAKYIIFHRPNATSSAIFGGVNIGDRFEDWKDFTIRVKGNNVVQELAESLSLHTKHPFASTTHQDQLPVICPVASLRHDKSASTSRTSLVQHVSDVLSSWVKRTPRSSSTLKECIRFVTNRAEGCSIWKMVMNRPFVGTYNVEPFLQRLFSDRQYNSYTVAMAYMDTRGAALIQLALERGADVSLVMPLHPNVYQDANRKALCRLMCASESTSGKLHAFTHHSMIHAKAIIAHSSKMTTSVLGSCNLKQRSFTQFTELNAISVDDAMNKALLTKMDDLVHESRPVALSDFGEQWIDGSMGIHDKGNLLPFWDLKANVEEWLG